MVRSQPFDLIICDVQLPKVDGYEVVRQLKNDAELSRTPIVAVTALAMVGDRERVLASGFDGYVSKPIDPETFVAQVEAFIRGN
jgi:two-component system cell cycle response regulator